MSQSTTENPAYAIVLWTKEGKCSVISTKLVDNKDMLYDKNLKGLVRYPNGKREPANGWPQYEGLVLRLGGKYYFE
jgi:hypothetical protein